jgi:hypothetical protein
MSDPLTPEQRKARITQLLWDIRGIQEEHGLRRKRTILDRIVRPRRRPPEMPPAERERMYALVAEVGELLEQEAAA